MLLIRNQKRLKALSDLQLEYKNIDFDDFDDWRAFLDLTESELKQTFELRNADFFKRVESFREELDVEISENGETLLSKFHTSKSCYFFKIADKNHTNDLLTYFRFPRQSFCCRTDCSPTLSGLCQDAVRQ